MKKVINVLIVLMLSVLMIIPVSADSIIRKNVYLVGNEATKIIDMNTKKVSNGEIVITSIGNEYSASINVTVFVNDRYISNKTISSGNFDSFGSISKGQNLKVYVKPLGATGDYSIRVDY